MDVEEIKQKRHYLSDKIARLLGRFEDETGLKVSDVDFARRVSHDEFGREVSKEYIVEVEVKL